LLDELTDADIEGPSIERKMDCSGVSILSARDRDAAEEPCANHNQPQEQKLIPPIQKFEANFLDHALSRGSFASPGRARANVLNWTGPTPTPV
jgi:hypothetical protein